MSTRLSLSPRAAIGSKAPRAQESQRSTARKKGGSPNSKRGPVASPLPRSPVGVDALDPIGENNQDAELASLIRMLQTELQAAREREIALVRSEASAIATCEVLQRQVDRMQQQIDGLVSAFHLALATRSSSELKQAMVEAIAADVTVSAARSLGTSTEQPISPPLLAQMRQVTDEALERMGVSADVSPRGDPPRGRKSWRIAGLKMIAVHRLIQAGAQRAAAAKAGSGADAEATPLPHATPAAEKQRRSWRIAGLKMIAVHRLIQAGAQRAAAAPA
jgi:hypothetical protein